MNQQRQPDEWSEPIPELESFEEAAALARSVEIPVMKVNQLDSGALDVELHNLLKLQLAPTFSMFSKGFLDEYKPEIEAIFSFVFWRCTVWDQIPTPGMRLQNLRYRDETAVKHAPIGSNPLFVPGFAEPRYSQRLSWGIISVGAPWIMGATRRFGLSHGWSHAPSRSPKRIAWTFLSKLQQFYSWRWKLTPPVVYFRHSANYYEN